MQGNCIYVIESNLLLIQETFTKHLCHILCLELLVIMIKEIWREFLVFELLKFHLPVQWGVGSFLCLEANIPRLVAKNPKT